MTREVHVEPMPAALVPLPMWLRHSPPPIFAGYEAGPSERALARKLFAELDAESQDWHRRSSPDLFAGL
jgi:hypothetical protein